MNRQKRAVTRNDLPQSGLTTTRAFVVQLDPVSAPHSTTTMTRRARTVAMNDDDDDTLVGENVEKHQGKEVTVKQENAKKGKARRVESDEGEDNAQEPSQPNDVEENGIDHDGEAEEDVDNEGEGTPRGRKRARINSVGASVPVSPNQVERERVQTLPRGDDGCVFREHDMDPSYGILVALFLDLLSASSCRTLSPTIL